MVDDTEQQERFLAHMSEEARDELRQFLPGGNAMQLVGDYLQQKSDEWKNEPLNVGIIGNSGAGKSSFINATRGLTADDEGAAPVNVRQETLKPTPFEHPNNPKLKYWDLPGVGTPDYPRDGYLERVGFENYDFFIIITRQRFTENDLSIAKEITRMKKKFFFVRTCVDNDVDNDKKAHPSTHNKEAVLETIRRDIKDNLGELYPEDGVFLIANYDKIAFDFHRLERRIFEWLPGLKREAFIFTGNSFSKEILELKYLALERRIGLIALSSGTVAALPVPGLSFVVDTGIILKGTEFFFQQLGLNDDSLKSLAMAMKCDLAPLRIAVAECKAKYLSSAGLLNAIKLFPAVAISMAAEEGIRFIPVLGTLAASSISFATTSLLLRKILLEMKEIAVKVIEIAVNSSSIQSE